MSEPAAVRFPAAGGALLDAHFFAPEAGGAARAVVLVHDVQGPTPALLAAARRVQAAGFACLVPNLWTREGAPGDALDARAAPAAARARAEALPDRRALEDLEGALVWLGARADVAADALGVVGLGMGGTLAFLVGCTSRRASAVVAWGGRPLYDALSSNKPVQPLELVLNLDRPLLILAGEDDPSLPQEHLQLWREKLASGAKDFELVTYPGAVPDPLADAAASPSSAAPRAGSASWSRVLAFLHERL